MYPPLTWVIKNIWSIATFDIIAKPIRMHFLLFMAQVDKLWSHLSGVDCQNPEGTSNCRGP